MSLSGARVFLEKQGKLRYMWHTRAYLKTWGTGNIWRCEAYKAHRELLETWGAQGSLADTGCRDSRGYRWCVLVAGQTAMAHNGGCMETQESCRGTGLYLETRGTRLKT